MGLAAIAAIAVMAALADEPAARWRVRHVPERSRVELELAVAGDADGVSDFSVPPGWGGVERIDAHLHDVAFRDAAGAPLAAKRVGDVGWRVAHPPGAALAATWWLGEPQPAARGTGNDYRPHADGERFHFLGSIGLLRPDALAGAAQHRFAVEFAGCEGEGRAAACSFGAGPRVVVEATLDAVCHSVFVGGAVRLHRRTAGAGELLFALAGEQAFRDEELVALATRIVGDERGFFGDAGDPLFVITLVPDLRAAGRSSLGGTGLTRSFALFMSAGFTLAPGSDDFARVALLLAHEHFHHWNGGIVRSDEREGLCYWFSEGFTDFYARRLLVRGGLIGVEQWLREWNGCLEAWWRNPARTAPAERIAREFWSDAGVSALPYQRGAVVAALLEREIVAQSGGARSLDDFMRDVVAAARAGERCDTEALLERAADETSAEFGAGLRAIVVDGTMPERDDLEGLFGPAFRTRWSDEPQPVPRFELWPGTPPSQALAGL